MNERRGLRWRVGDAIDEFAHRRLGFGMVGTVPGHARCAWYWRLTPFPFICNRRELSYGVPWATVYPTSGTNAYTSNVITKWVFHFHDQMGKITHNPACALVLTNGRSACNCIVPGPSGAAIDAEARRIHRCSEGYDGPCWGPTDEDRHQAVKNLAPASTTNREAPNEEGT